MAKIELELSDDVLEHAQHVAEARHSTLDALISEALMQLPVESSKKSPIGLFADDAEALDQIVEWAMEARERVTLRLPYG